MVIAPCLSYLSYVHILSVGKKIGSKSHHELHNSSQKSWSDFKKMIY